MSKTVKISVTCPQCATKLAVPITEDDLGTKKPGACPKCHKKFLIPISAALASKFESDPTCIGDANGETTLVIETVPNASTVFQSFELTSDYYTIGRQNTSGPEYRPDVEVVTSDRKMGRKHAAIRKRGKTGFVIKDLGSKNGVTLNGNGLEPDEEVYLNDGDQFRLGDTLFRVSLAEQSMDSDELTV